ncbi:MAG TPA: hypothetical protein DCQ06_10365 [Myxococcales bacterium]|nr:hypothetical protein [Myxococcales bacterium]HAN31989.1 hypothetical protein [Myxococcales bacterium]
MANSKKGTKQVNPPTPKQRVESAFGGKKALVNDLIGLMGGDSSLRTKLMQVSNARLVKHHHATKRMVENFGSKSGLIEAITALRFPKGSPDEGYSAKLESYSPWRLMDLHRQTKDWEVSQAKAAKVAARESKIKAKRRAKIRSHRS